MNILLIDYFIFAEDLKTELEKTGFKVRVVKSHFLNREAFEKHCRELTPIFVVSINFSPEIAYLCSQMNLIYLSWTVDPLPESRFEIFKGTKPELCLIFTHRSSLSQRFSAMGFKNSYFLPLAAPTDRRKPIENKELLEPYRCDISFVGQSLVSEKTLLDNFLKTHKPKKETIEQFYKWLEQFYTGFAENNSFAGLSPISRAIPDHLIDGFEKKPAFDKIHDHINGYLSSELRLKRVKALKGFDLNVYGDENWEKHTPHYKGIADHGEELTKIYNASRINLDMPRIYQRDIITMRVFDIMASGSVILTEKSTDLCTIFKEDVQLVCYENTADMVSKIKKLLANENLRKDIAANGYEEVIKHHKISQRVTAMLEQLNKISKEIA